MLSGSVNYFITIDYSKLYSYTNANSNQSKTILVN